MWVELGVAGAHGADDVRCGVGEAGEGVGQVMLGRICDRARLVRLVGPIQIVPEGDQLQPPEGMVVFGEEGGADLVGGVSVRVSHGDAGGPGNLWGQVHVRRDERADAVLIAAGDRYDGQLDVALAAKDRRGQQTLGLDRVREGVGAGCPQVVQEVLLHYRDRVVLDPHAPLAGQVLTKLAGEVSDVAAAVGGDQGLVRQSGAAEGGERLAGAGYVGQGRDVVAVAVLLESCELERGPGPAPVLAGHEADDAVVAAGEQGDLGRGQRGPPSAPAVSAGAGPVRSRRVSCAAASRSTPSWKSVRSAMSRRSLVRS